MNETRFGVSPDFSMSFGDRLRESIRRRLTFSGAQEAWWEKNADKLEKFKAVETQLSPKQREYAMAKLERAAKKDAFGEVSLNYVALASIIGSLYVGAKILYDALIGYNSNPKLDRIRHTLRHPLSSLRDTLDRANRLKTTGSKPMYSVKHS